ncbi:hypothetical protein BRD56_12910 [Thermoplasmatales archaeon SW_10_69_26]|nr:MAG: hypothetical protein BRD56_12910 [Thermoplasmatales archaeon SW_10_69_26]
MVSATDDVRQRLPDVQLRWAILAREDPPAEAGKPAPAAIEQARQRSLDEVGADPIAETYRSFFWAVDVDPTKRRPAGEALARRSSEGGLPEIHPLVDAYNRASAATLVALSAFDRDALAGELTLDVADEDEALDALGEADPVQPVGDQPVWRDDEGLVGLSAYRDGQRTALSADSRQAIVVALAPDEVSSERVAEAFTLTEQLAEPAGWHVDEATTRRLG